MINTMAGSKHRKQLREEAANSARRVGDLERELRVSVERYELVWQATHDVLYDLDIASGTIIWNKALQEQFGYTADEPAGTLEWWVSHIHPEDALGVERSLYEWYESHLSTWRSEYRFRRADGSYRYVLDRGYVIRGPAHEPQRIIGTLLDVTQSKELSRAKDEFISLVSHQLRTPLTVIRVYGEMFSSGMFGSVSEVQAQHIARMTGASIRLIKLVDEILNVSRLELGNYQVKASWIDSSALVRRCIQAVQPIAQAKQTSIMFSTPDDLPPLYTDAEILVHVVDNLLTNAVRYTRAGHGIIEVTIELTEDSWQLSVRDNGIGIPKAAQAHVFERFYRAHNAVNIEEHGTGLGLYLAQSLTATLGGRIWFTSKSRAGTTFHVSLPIG